MNSKWLFLKYTLSWISGNLSIPFWMVGHVHLTMNVYEDIYEIIASFGMNYQNCTKIAFASISYSYEKFYQAVRRSWRYGQTKPVDVYVVIAESETPIWRAVERKAMDHDMMKDHMKYAVFSKGESSEIKIDYNPTYKARLPEWLLHN